MYRSEAASPDRWKTPHSQRTDSMPIENQRESNNKNGGDKVSFRSVIPSRRRSLKRGECLIMEEKETRMAVGAVDDGMPSNDLRQQQGRTNEKGSAAQLLVFSLLENTGAHGIPNIKRAQNYTRKILWTVLFLFGMSMFIWQTVGLLNKYYAFEVDTKMEISSDRMLEFPAVTICNLNGIKSDYLDELIKNGEDVPPSLVGPIPGYGNVPPSGIDEQFSMVDDATKLVAGLNYANREETGHRLKDMLLRCVFKGKPCHASDFVHFYHYLYGNCYIFNSGVNRTEQRRFSTRAGPLYGLTIEMYIEQDQYIDDVQPAAGARVTVHPQSDMPFPEDVGVSVSPGDESFIGITRTNFTRIVSPYTNCTPSEANSSQTVFNRIIPSVRYSQRACENDCFYQMVRKECGCADVRFRYDNQIPLCSQDSENECAERVESLYLNGQLGCMCTPPCREISFGTMTAHARWPNEKLKPYLLDNLRNVSDDLEKDIDTENDPNFIEKNVLKINVYYDKLEITNIYQEKAYDEIALLSDMGGNVGLWIGVSVLTVFEFLELGFDLIKLIVYKLLDKTSHVKTNGKVMSSDLDLIHVSNLKP